jgi:hypothetical protein
LLGEKMGIGFGKKTFELLGFGWSYGGFHNFRKRLGKEIQIELDSMEGFGGSQSWDTIHSPIKELLHHSDCDGILTPEQCKRIYPELLLLIQNWEPDDCDKVKSIKLAETMKDCAEEEVDLVFC